MIVEKLPPLWVEENWSQSQIEDYKLNHRRYIFREEFREYY